MLSNNQARRMMAKRPSKRRELKMNKEMTTEQIIAQLKKDNIIKTKVEAEDCFYQEAVRYLLARLAVEGLVPWDWDK